MKMKTCLFIVALFISNVALADFGDKLATFNFPATQFAMHPMENHLYVTSASQDSVMIIDTTTLSLVDTVWIGSNPQGLAFSESGDKLYVATTGASFIEVVDTNSMEITESLLVPQRAYDLEMGCNGILYATPAPRSIGIMRIDSNSGDYLGDFSGGVFIYHYGLLQVSTDKQYLYFCNRGLSPGTLARYNISGSAPILERKNGHGDLGSNGQDIALSNSGDWVTYAVGGGNFGYDIALIQSANFQILGSFNLGPYPREAQFSPDDKIFYAVHTGGHIDVWDTETFLKLPSMSTSGEAYELFVEPRGRYLFAAIGSELRVYDTGRTVYIPELESIEIAGPNEVAENSSTSYTAIAHYDDGSAADVTGPAVWSVEPNSVASIDENGLLVTEDVDIPGEYITIYAEYTEDDVTVEAEKEVSVFAVCLRGSALQFDGVNDYADGGSTFADVVGSGTKTIMAWVKSDTTSYPSDTPAGAGRILTLYRESGSSGFTIYAQDDPATWKGLYRKAANVAQDIDSGVSVVANEWTHVALVQDGADVDIYINGVSENSASDGAAPTTRRHVNADIGAYDAETAMKCFFDGLIDEVAIYDGALSGEEIQANMHVPADDGEPNLVAYWDFDEGEGQVVYDMSGNGNDGYLGSDPCGPDNSDPNWVDSDAPTGFCTQPIANAGPDQTVSAGAGCVAEVTLDGSDSNDADGDELTYAWLMGSEEIATGVNPVIELPMGEHTVELVVNDGFEDSEADEVVITVVDATPPELSLSVEPNVLWPPNGKMVQVRPEWEVSDNCDEEVEVSLVDISMNVEGDVNNYVEMGGDGSIYLRARRAKGKDIRVYTLTYEAVDDSGNVTEESATVAVRHRKGPRKLLRRSWKSPDGRLRRQVYRRGLQHRGGKK